MGAFMETKGLIQEGVRWVGAVMVASIVMLGLIAWAHDGEVAQTIVQQLIGVLVWGMPVVAAMLIGNQTASAFVAIKGGNSTPQATAQPAPVATPAPAVAVAESAL